MPKSEVQTTKILSLLLYIAYSNQLYWPCEHIHRILLFRLLLVLHTEQYTGKMTILYI